MDFVFKKKNFTLLFVGIAFILSGLILMIEVDQKITKFSDEIFNFQRLTLAPILIAIGFIIEFFAIMLVTKSEEDKSKWK